jgi:hypothetical protein
MYQGLQPALQGVIGQVLATGIASATCNIQMQDGTFGPSGAPSQNYVPVAGLQGLIVMNAPKSVGDRVGASKEKAVEQQTSFDPRHVWLAGFYPEIVTQYQAVVTDPLGNTITFDILGVEADSQALTTRMEVRLVGI